MTRIEEADGVWAQTFALLFDRITASGLAEACEPAPRCVTRGTSRPLPRIHLLDGKFLAACLGGNCSLPKVRGGLVCELQAFNPRSAWSFG
jgi:hypothetical protein